MPFDTTSALLLIAAFFAGFIDAIVGGGGLIQLPALLVLRPDLALATTLGTNKLPALLGTAVATSKYIRAVADVSWRTLLPGAVVAFTFSWLGSLTASLLNPQFLKPLILVLLVAVALYTFLKKNLGSLHAPKLTHRQQLVLGIVTGAIIGFYDGFCGPGTGSFLVFTFVGLYGFNFLAASASAKVVNLATNLAATLYFGLAGHIDYSIALPMAAFNIAGATIGARLAIFRGSAFVRVLFLVVVGVLIVKLGFDVMTMISPPH